MPDVLFDLLMVVLLYFTGVLDNFTLESIFLSVINFGGVLDGA